MLLLFILLLAIIVAVTVDIRRKKRAAGISGWVQDHDLDSTSSGKKYVNIKAGVVCKPDLVEIGKVVEHKSRMIGNQPLFSDMMQLAIQMSILGATTGELKYRNRSFCFDRSDPRIQKAFESARAGVRQMQYHIMTRIAPKGTPRPNKCRICAVSSLCPDYAAAASSENRGQIH